MNEHHSELTSRQLERQDFVEDVIHADLDELSGKDLPYDAALIGAVRDVIAAEFEERGIMDKMDFYPFFDE